MLNPSRFCNILRIDRESAVCLVTFIYLILFSAFNSLKFEMPLDLKPYQPKFDELRNELQNLAVKDARCSFSISDYNATTPRYICYLLLVFTIIIRNHKWLAAGAAASVLTYSGVAAIHLVILFATNNMLKPQEAKTYCKSLPIPGANTSFVACAGVTDPDVGVSMTFVTSVILGALPTVAWSQTFRRSTRKAILLLWLLLLAVGHTFYALTQSNPRRQFQICPKDYIEPLPKVNFQAPFLDQSWSDSFSSLDSTAQPSSQSPRNSSSPACIYSCFATTAYFGRKNQNLVVWQVFPPVGPVHSPIPKNNATHRRFAITAWWAYTFLVALALFTTARKGRLAKGLDKFSIVYPREPGSPRWKRNIAIKRTGAIITADSSEATTSLKNHITMLKVVQIFTQIGSVGAFFGSILVQETQNAREWKLLSQEPFAAVGQWSHLAVVLLVLVAAGVGRIWAGTGAGSAVVEEERRLEEEFELDYRRDGEDEDVGTEKEDWDWRVGYAS